MPKAFPCVWSLTLKIRYVAVYSILERQYGEFFGFTISEVEVLLEKTNLQHRFKKVFDWYNGYQAGELVLYNPWSIINFINMQGKFRPYWVNMSDNALLKMLLISSIIAPIQR